MRSLTILFALCIQCYFMKQKVSAFQVSTRISTGQHMMQFMVTDADQESTTTEEKLSLEDKMKSWEATEEEQKAASLLGVVPGRTDAFDVGLYFLFPFMVISGLVFAFFPFIMENIDVSSVGPPPTV